MGVGQQNTNSQQDNGNEDWDALKGDVGDIAGAAVERSRYFIDSAREQATDYADRRKDDVAASVADFANSLRESTRSFDERPNIRAVVDSAAEGLEQLAESIRERTFADFFNEFEDVVRRRPATVAAVSVAVGFLAARFIKSTAEDLRYDDAGHAAARGARAPVRQAQRPRTTDRRLVGTAMQGNNQTIQGLVGEALRESTDLAQKELTLFRTEISQNIRTLFLGLAMVVVAAIFAIAALMLLTESLVEWLATVVNSEALAALIVGGVMALIAIGLGLWGRSTMTSSSLAPERTMRSLKRDAEVLSERGA